VIERAPSPELLELRSYVDRVGSIRKLAKRARLSAEALGGHLKGTREVPPRVLATIRHAMRAPLPLEGGSTFFVLEGYEVEALLCFDRVRRVRAEVAACVFGIPIVELGSRRGQLLGAADLVLVGWCHPVGFEIPSLVPLTAKLLEPVRGREFRGALDAAGVLRPRRARS
jgi:hypothetical protein